MTRRLMPRRSKNTKKGRPFRSSGKASVEGLSVDESKEEPRYRVGRIEGSTRIEDFRTDRHSLSARMQETQRSSEFLQAQTRRPPCLVLNTPAKRDNVFKIAPRGSAYD